jgi:predicted AlkP superfamily phosphohydrolase/phosphomutase
MPVSGSAPPVLVIGLDGATFQLLGPWIENGELPCLSRLCRDGVRGMLQSVTPPLSPEAWSTFMTGKHPGLHGVMNFLCFRPGTYQLQFSNGSLLRGRTLWRILSEAGKRVGVMGVPMTYPPEPVNGYLVTGIETPSAGSGFTHPEGLADELRQALGGYDLHGDFLDSGDPEEYLRRLLEMIDNQVRAACYLVKRYPADLSVCVIGATDRVQHAFWRYMDAGHPWHESGAAQAGAHHHAALRDAVKTAFRRVDDALAEIMECVPEPRNVVVMSDHGFGPCHTMVHLNEWLEQRGYLALRPRKSVGLSALHRGYVAASRRTPRWLKDAAKSRLPALRRRMTSSLVFGNVSWPETKAFAISTQHGYVYLNRRDRFPQGPVEPGAEADQLCERLAAELSEMCDPETGEAMVARVVHTCDEYRGPACGALPDLIVLWRDGYVSRAKDIRPRGHQRIVEPTGRSIDEWSGSHRAEGVLIAHGPAFASPRTVEGARIVDLAPTVLHLLGLPVPDDMTGRVLEQILGDRFLSDSPVRYAPAGKDDRPRSPGADFTAEESAEVAERLRRMGYL